MLPPPTKPGIRRYRLRSHRLSSKQDGPADLGRWIGQRDRIYTQIMEHGWNPQRRAFTQHDQTEVLDASLLMMPLVGFVAPRDPMWLQTLDAMDGELVSDSLVFRYDPVPLPAGGCCRAGPGPGPWGSPWRC
jgi:GH15 family glucan-1,4-alpha-glucosidase